MAATAAADVVDGDEEGGSRLVLGSCDGMTGLGRKKNEDPSASTVGLAPSAAVTFIVQLILVSALSSHVPDTFCGLILEKSTRS